MANTPNLGLRKIDSKTELFNQTLNYEANFDKVDAHAGVVIAQLGEIETKQGLLSSLLTTAKASVVDAINELFNSKANKVQENWITTTLLNGWVSFTAIGSTVQYMKDNHGFVHVRGFARDGTSNVIAILPVGYRPTFREDFSAPRGVSVYIDNAGNIIRDSTVNSGVLVSLSGITFKAV